MSKKNIFLGFTYVLSFSWVLLLAALIAAYLIERRLTFILALLIVFSPLVVVPWAWAGYIRRRAISNNFQGGLLCLLFDHKFGSWEYFDETTCQKKQKCKNCTKENIKTVPHEFSDWKFLDETSCERMRVCKRDGYKEMGQAPHQFGEWEYLANDSCEQKRTCHRDGYEERRRMPHQFDEWRYINDKSCAQVRVCKRDGYQETREALHKYSEWKAIRTETCKRVSRCIRCDHEGYEFEHDWIEAGTRDEYGGTNKLIDYYLISKIYKCSKCNEEKEEYVGTEER